LSDSDFSPGVRYLAVAVVTVIVALAGTGAAARTASAGAPGGTTFTIDNLDGFDTCAAPSSSTMTAWWNASQYYFVGIYLGGVNRGCSQPNLTAGWVSAVAGQGWSFIPTWVSYQAPYPQCSTRQYSAYISLATATAYNQGVNAAQAAETAAIGLGFAAGTIVYLDVEGYVANSGCRAAVGSYVSGWVAQLNADRFKAGVYGSACSSYPQDWDTLAHAPGNVWIAGGPTANAVWNLCSTLPNSDWVTDNRVHQYQLNRVETWGGASLLVDDDCAVARIAQGSLALGDEFADDVPGGWETDGPAEDPSC
jgi:hypothetical protein